MWIEMDEKKEWLKEESVNILSMSLIYVQRKGKKCEKKWMGMLFAYNQLL